MRTILFLSLALTGCGELDLERPKPAGAAARAIRASDNSWRVATPVGEFATWAPSVPPELVVAISRSAGSAVEAPPTPVIAVVSDDVRNRNESLDARHLTAISDTE